MIYLAWAHLHFTPKMQNYRLSSIAITLATDMGITRRPGKGQHQRMNIENVSVIPTGLVPINEDFWNYDIQRAYLGCYWISTWYSILTRKTCLLSYSEYLYSCARSLQSRSEFESDAFFIYSLELTREAQRVYSLFNYAETDELQSMSDGQLQVYLNVCLLRVHEWQLRAPPALARDPCQQLWTPVFEALAREIGLQGVSRTGSLSIPRVKILLDALMSTKSYLDMFLAIPLGKLAHLPAVHWSLFNYSILLAANISLVSQGLAWNLGTARSIIKLEMYLDSASMLVKELSSSISPAGEQQNWYDCLLKRWEVVRTSYMIALHRSRVEITISTSVSPPETLQDANFMNFSVQNGQDRINSGQFQNPDNMFPLIGGFEPLCFPNNIDAGMGSPGLQVHELRNY
ncbi:hypothetical protein F5884DRAFT_40825 [Xylogone sp. PMI_703]|nr:hypothetical protein F5884DRAFT_40825 [Xylogone sp. PMI_703]